MQAPNDIPLGQQDAAAAEARPASAELTLLYARSFAEYGTRALWNIKQLERPTVANVLAITRQLRTEGDMNARDLAEKIEQVARADL